MISRTWRRWGFALTLLIGASSGFAAEPELSADAPISADFKTNELVAVGHARFEHEDVVVEADEIRFNQTTRTITGTGNVRVTRRGLRVVSDRITYNIDTRAFSSGPFRAGTPPLFVEGEAFAGNLDEFEISRAQIYYLEPDAASPSVKLETATIRPGERVSGQGVTLGLPFLGGIPLPSFDRELSAPSLDFEGNAGFRSRLGVYVQSEMLMPVNEDLKVGLNLDGYSRRGVLIGPALRFAKTLTDGSRTTVSLSAGWIADQGEDAIRGVDVLEVPIDRDRYLADLDITHRRDDFELVLHTAALSDSEVERDFRPDRFNAQPQPDSFLELNQLIGDDIFLSVFIERNPHEFFRNIERLPEITLEMPLRPVGDTGLIHGAKLRYVRLRAWGANIWWEDANPWYSMATSPWPLAGALDFYASNRWDNLAEAIYTLRYPIRLGHFATLTPLVEANFTVTRPGEEKPDDGFAPYRWGLTRGEGILTSAGFDLEATFYADFKVQSDSWNIRSLRHIVQPVVQVRHLWGHDWSGQSGHFPTFDTIRPELDLLVRRDRFGLDRNGWIARYGLKNTLFATGKNGDSRELATLGLFLDQSFRENLALHTDDNAYLEFSARPARWLELRYDQKFNLARKVQEARLRTILRSAEAWELALSLDFLDGIYHQYRAEGAYRLSERATFIGGWRFDAHLSELTRQTYGIRYRLGQAWQLEGAIVLRRGARREDDISFEARVQILQF